MRLTLRNLLNYMDDMLEPSDAAEIRKKVEESQFASDLLQRTRTVTGRMRLGAPKVTGRGMGVDANTVSDYLDHVLDSDDVQEFEKICLESDIHLAEVAGCHQILALILGEPANVDSGARDRMYQLKALRHEKTDADEPEETASAETATETTEPVAMETQGAAASDVGPREKPEVPDYLRDSRRMPLWSVVATVLIAAALGLGLWMKFDPNNPISAWLNGGDDPLAMNEPTVPPTDVPEIPGGPADPMGPTPAPKTSVDDMPPSGVTKPPREITDKPGGDPGSPETGGNPKVPDTIKLPAETTLPKDPPKKPDPDAGLIPEIDDPAKKPDPDEPIDPMPTDPSGKPVEAEPKEPAKTGPVEVGRFLSTDQLLVRKDEDQNDWFLVPVRASLVAGDRVLALPTFRPTITLSAGVTLQVPGGTSLEFLSPDESGMAGVRLFYGRLVLLNNGTVGTRFRVQLGDDKTPREGVVTFSGPTSTAAIEVRRDFRPGENPEDEKTPLVAELCASGGQIVWEEQGALKTREEIDPKAHLELRSNVAAKRIQGSDVFAWLETDEISKRDALASPEMKKHFEKGRSVVLGLKELAAHRRFEVRSLAVRGLGHLDYFEPLVASFGDSEQRVNWQPNFESLRDALTRGTVVAGQVREAFERQRGDDAKEMYRMIWGYSPEQLESGAAAQLVEYLMHDDMDYRVMAFRNLMDITGFTLFYRADDTALKRRVSVRRWKDKLDAGEIKHREKGA